MSNPHLHWSSLRKVVCQITRQEQANKGKMLYLHEEVPHWLCRPASMFLNRDQLHPLKTHTTSCTACCVPKGGGGSTLSHHDTNSSCWSVGKTCLVAFAHDAQCRYCNQQALSWIVRKTTTSLRLFAWDIFIRQPSEAGLVWIYETHTHVDAHIFALTIHSSEFCAGTSMQTWWTASRKRR